MEEDQLIFAVDDDQAPKPRMSTGAARSLVYGTSWQGEPSSAAIRIGRGASPTSSPPPPRSLSCAEATASSLAPSPFARRPLLRSAPSSVARTPHHHHVVEAQPEGRGTDDGDDDAEHQGTAEEEEEEEEATKEDKGREEEGRGDGLPVALRSREDTWSTRHSYSSLSRLLVGSASSSSWRGRRGSSDAGTSPAGMQAMVPLSTSFDSEFELNTEPEVIHTGTFRDALSLRDGQLLLRLKQKQRELKQMEAALLKKQEEYLLLKVYTCSHLIPHRQ